MRNGRVGAEVDDTDGAPKTGRRGGGRPRDELGRPLPRNEANRLVLEDFDRLDRPENNRLGMAHLVSGQNFGAHEAWERCWKQSRGTDDAEGFKGLAQLAAGYVHMQRGNRYGCRVLLVRAIRRLSGYQAGWQGIDLPRLITDAEALLADADPLPTSALSARPISADGYTA